MMRYLYLVFIFVFQDIHVNGQGFEANHRHGGEKNRGERQETFDVSQWYRGPREPAATRPPPSNEKPSNLHSPVLRQTQASESPYYHPTSGQRSRSIDPWRSTFPQSPFYNPDPRNYKSLGSPLDNFQRDIYNDDYFRQKGVPLNAQAVHKIAPGITGQVLYTADSLESLEKKINRESAQRDKNMVSSTERQLFQILGHVSSNTHVYDYVPSNTNAGTLDDQEVKYDTENQSKRDQDDDSKQNTVSNRSISREDAADHENDEDTEVEDAKEELTDLEEGDENPDEFSLEETSSKSPTLVAATGIPPRWTKLPLLPPATPPAAKRGSFYNSRVNIDADHYNAHHRPDHGLSAASVFARIKPHIKGDALPKEPLPPNPKRTTPKPHHHQEESEENYDEDYSYEELHEEGHPHFQLSNKTTSTQRTTTIPVSEVTSEESQVNAYTTTPVNDEKSSQTSMSSTTESQAKIHSIEKSGETKAHASLLNEDEEELPLMKSFKNVNLKEVLRSNHTTAAEAHVEHNKTFKKASREGKIKAPVEANSEEELASKLPTSTTSAGLEVQELSRNSKESNIEATVDENHNEEKEDSDTEQVDKDDLKKKNEKQVEEKEQNKEIPTEAEVEEAKQNKNQSDETQELPSKSESQLSEAKNITLNIKPGDIKTLLTTSEGQSLSEILQSHGITLPEFLKNGLKIAVMEKVSDGENTRKITESDTLLTTSTASSATASSTGKVVQPSSLKPAFDMSKIKPVSISELLKGKVDIKKPSNLFSAIFDRTSTKAPIPESSTTSTTTEPSKWSTRTKLKAEEPQQQNRNDEVASQSDSKAENSEMTTQIAIAEPTTITTKKVLKPYSPPAGMGEYGVFEGGRGNSYGGQRPIQRTRTEGRTNKRKPERTEQEESDEVEDSNEADSEAVTAPPTESTTVIVVEEEEIERTKFIDIPVEIRGAIIASSAIGGFALIVFLVIFIILWKRNRKVQAGVRASHLIRRAIENATSGGGDSETSSTSDTIFNATTGYRKNGFWGTLGRSVWK